eukprot:2024004-Prymnesium_polylepis.1
MDVRFVFLDGTAREVIVEGVRDGATHAIDTVVKHMNSWSSSVELSMCLHGADVVYTRGEHGASALACRERTVALPRRPPLACRVVPSSTAQASSRGARRVRRPLVRGRAQVAHALRRAEVVAGERRDGGRVLREDPDRAPRVGDADRAA